MPKDQNQQDISRPPKDKIKEIRRENPSGWMQLAKSPARALLIDALIESPPQHKFTAPQIAERAGISDQSVRNHIEELESLGVVENVSGNTYIIKEKSRVMMELDHLVSAVTAIRSGAARKTAEDINPDLAMDNSQADSQDQDSAINFGDGPGRMITNAD